MMETGSMASTEYFFDLYERNSHAVKILFHAIEIGWISLFGYSIQIVRLLSLIAGTASLFLLYHVILRMVKNRWSALFGMVLMSLDIQYIYTSHTARQEIWLILILLVSLFLLTESFNNLGNRSFSGRKYVTDTVVGLILGISFGFHPNGAVILFPALGYYIYYIIKVRKPALKKMLVFSGVLVLTSVLFLIISLRLNSSFISDYAAYGETLGVLNSPGTKLAGWVNFYKKIFYQVSGTYYTPDIRIQFFLYGLVIAASLLAAVFRPKSRKTLIALLTGLIGMQVVYILIGRFGQPSIVLNLPVAVIIASVISAFLYRYGKLWIRTLVVTCCVLAVLSTGIMAGREIKREIENNSGYEEYLDQIAAKIPVDSAVLCNINAEPLINYGNLYDRRNIGRLSESGISFSRYILDRDIKFIVYSEEIDFIYRHRPLWNGIYGNIAPVYEEIQEFLKLHCEQIGKFTSRTYAMRIVRYQQDKEWEVTLYATGNVGN